MNFCHALPPPREKREQLACAWAGCRDRVRIASAPARIFCFVQNKSYASRDKRAKKALVSSLPKLRFPALVLLVVFAPGRVVHKAKDLISSVFKIDHVLSPHPDLEVPSIILSWCDSKIFQQIIAYFWFMCLLFFIYNKFTWRFYYRLTINAHHNCAARCYSLIRSIPGASLRERSRLETAWRHRCSSYDHLEAVNDRGQDFQGHLGSTDVCREWFIHMFFHRALHVDV